MSRAGRRTSTRHVVVMGVSGVGKSAVAGRIAAELGMELADGDDFHPLSNIAKMKQGIPLDDADRRPWLECLTEWTAKRADAGVSTVLACSALRRSYRDALRRADPDTYFVHLVGDERTLVDRMQAREHFMPAELLRSQTQALEPLGEDERGVVVDVTAGLDEVVTVVLAALDTEAPPD
ncbi:MAG: gluconokinase [Nocardioidaceae bacterium]